LAFIQPLHTKTCRDFLDQSHFSRPTSIPPFYGGGDGLPRH